MVDTSVCRMFQAPPGPTVASGRAAIQAGGHRGSRHAAGRKRRGYGIASCSRAAQPLNRRLPYLRLAMAPSVRTLSTHTSWLGGESCAEWLRRCSRFIARRRATRTVLAPGGCLGRKRAPYSRHAPRTHSCDAEYAERLDTVHFDLEPLLPKVGVRPDGIVHRRGDQACPFEIGQCVPPLESQTPSCYHLRRRAYSARQGWRSMADAIVGFLVENSVDRYGSIGYGSIGRQVARSTVPKYGGTTFARPRRSRRASFTMHPRGDDSPPKSLRLSGTVPSPLRDHSRKEPVSRLGVCSYWIGA